MSLVINTEGSALTLKGVVTLDNVTASLRTIEAQLATISSVDLSGLLEVNSVCVSLLVETAKIAHQRSLAIQFQGASQQLCSIADVCCVADLLKLD